MVIDILLSGEEYCSFFTCLSQIGSLRDPETDDRRTKRKRRPPLIILSGLF